MKRKVRDMKFVYDRKNRGTNRATRNRNKYILKVGFTSKDLIKVVQNVLELKYIYNLHLDLTSAY